MTLKDKVKEVIERNFGDIDNIVNTINNMILIYSIIKTDKSLDKSQKYESIVIELQELKTIFQIEKIEYLNKLNSESGIRIWCINCDLDMEYKGIALNCETDVIFFTCKGCNIRIIVFLK